MKCFDPQIVRTVTLENKNYVMNDRFYLVDFHEWDPQVQDWLAEKENLALNEEHLHILKYLRTTFRNSEKHPTIRMVTGDFGRLFGSSKGTVKYFHTLFPGGIHQAFLVAGLPMQDSCC